MSAWFVYIILCDDESLYTGITNNLEKRFEAHKNGRGAKYFRGREPREIVYHEECAGRSGASIREAELKKLARDEKLKLIDQFRQGSSY